MTKVFFITGTDTDVGKTHVACQLIEQYITQGLKVIGMKPVAAGCELVNGEWVNEDVQKLTAASNVDAPKALVNPYCFNDYIAPHLAAEKAGVRIEISKILQAFNQLKTMADVVIVEGAGSPAEINLREGDIANMGFAEAADCPVILIADIDRGGVFAHIVGTLALLSESEQKRVVGFVINRFRGDIALLQSGLDWLEQETGKPVLGVLPYLHDFHLEAEDAISKNISQKNADGKLLKVIVPVLPHISNHTDFDALRLHPDVDFQFIKLGDYIPKADLMILPGSKNVRADMQHLKDYEWERAFTRHLRYGGKLLGVCGGFQMLGNAIHDPNGVEGPAGTCQAFGWLLMETLLEKEKQLKQVSGKLSFAEASMTGYEIHMGVSTGEAMKQPALWIEDDDGTTRAEGAISLDKQIAGTYMHGLFDHSEACAAWLQWAGLEAPTAFDYAQVKEDELNRLADSLEEHLDWTKLAAHIPV